MVFVGRIEIRHVCRVAFMFFWGREARKKGCSYPTREWIGLEMKFTEMIGLWKFFFLKVFCRLLSLLTLERSHLIPLKT